MVDKNAPSDEQLLREAGLLLQASLDQLPDPFFVKNLRHEWIGFNQAFCALLGQPAEAIRGKSDPDFFPPEQVEGFWAGDDAIFTSGQTAQIEEPIDHADGSVHTLWTRKFPLRGRDHAVIGLCGFITDISELRRRQDAVARLEQLLREQEGVISSQAGLLDELAVPTIEVWDGVVLLPLIGSIDSRRAQRVMERMLEAITTSGAHHVILDISGVPLVDTAVAAALLQGVQASRLLGCTCVLVGIGPEIAQTLVQLGVDFSQIATRASLKQALQGLLVSRV